MNLLQNALDAAGEGARINIDIELETDLCRLTVSDNGPGIDGQMRKELFQPFATTKSEGLGLGLVISQEIMRGLGGDLLAEESDLGEGARFSMLIPLR